MAEKLNIGVVGAGVFGNYHAGKCAAHARLNFVGIFDPNHDNVRAAATKHGTKAYDNCNELLADVNAVIVASPAAHHGPIGAAALRADCHVLVEKPFASSIEIAEDMVRLAKEKDLVLQVGHQERFVGRAIGLDRAPKRPLKIRATRFGPQSVRGTDVSVTLDLMIHDLDMAVWLMGETPSKIDSETMVVYSANADVARAQLHFPSGGVVDLEASRAEEGRERMMTITYPDGELVIDFVAKTFSDTTGYGFNADFAANEAASDSLGAGTNAFVCSILDRLPVAVPGQAGLEAVRLALQIDDKLA